MERQTISLATSYLAIFVRWMRCTLDSASCLGKVTE
jgi:hypothetical protein